MKRLAVPTTKHPTTKLKKHNMANQVSKNSLCFIGPLGLVNLKLGITGWRYDRPAPDGRDDYALIMSWAQ
jgi:hypothetical protein